MTNRITLEEYQAFVEASWISAGTPEQNELRIVLGLIGELGEIAEETKKYLRNGGDVHEYRRRITLEFGDHLFYLAKYANFLDIDLEDALVKNTFKLIERKEQGTIKEL